MGGTRRGCCHPSWASWDTTPAVTLRGKEKPARVLEVEEFLLWVWAGRRVGAPWVGAGQGKGGSVVRGRGRSRTTLILVVFGEELGGGHRGAQPKLLHEALHHPGTWGERERG